MAFLHNHVVEPIGVCSVSRFCRDNRQRIEIPSHPVVHEYASNYGGVDRKDRDTSDWTTSIRTTRFYLRIFFWLLDATIHLMYNIVISAPWKPEWKKYHSKNKGRSQFQIDLALELGAYAIQRDWDGDLDNEAGKPAWMRQGRLMPCWCGACFFCIKGLTNGIDHKTATKPPPAHQVPVQCTGLRCRIRSACQHCSVCYKIQSQRYTGDLKGQEKFKYIRPSCAMTRNGCPSCNIEVCDFHWAYDFTHNPADYHHGHR